MFEEEGGLDALEALQYSDNNELFERASQLIREFYVSSYLLPSALSLSHTHTSVLHRLERNDVNRALQGGHHVKAHI